MTIRLKQGRHRLSLIPALILMAIVASCEGPMGPSGDDALGVDVVPPTILIVDPYPFDNVWGEFTISVTAVDNVKIRDVVFNVDGSSLVGDQLLILTEPPYDVEVDLSDLESGWHFVSARAYDTAGNVTESPVVPIRLGRQEDLQDTVVVQKYHSGVPFALWSIPDTSRINAYWARFSIARPCRLDTVFFHGKAVITDTAAVNIEIWTGNEFPVELDTTVSLGAAQINDTLRAYRAFFYREMEEAFFVVFRLVNAADPDTFFLSSDNGVPFWKRSGSRDLDGWHRLRSRYARHDNFLVTSSFYYERTIPDSAS